jgi:hypothetical protein
MGEIMEDGDCVYTEPERAARKPIRAPLKAIRAHCLECVCGSAPEVKLCTDENCWLYPFRLGKNPFRAPPSEKQREHGRRLAAEMHGTPLVD